MVKRMTTLNGMAANDWNDIVDLDNRIDWDNQDGQGDQHDQDDQGKRDDWDEWDDYDDLYD